jgi:twinkle protein
MLPKATAVTLPAKDPNECVIQGMELALCNAVLFKKDKPKNTRLIWAHDLLDEAAREVPMGLSWPWPTLTEYTRGMRLGETMYIGSGVKMGKTTIVATLIAHLITEHNMQVFCAQPEEATPYTTRLVMGKLAKRIFHDPKIKFDHEAYDRARPLIQDKLILLDLYQSLDWTTLRSDIHAAVREGCQAVFIDPVTNLTNLVDSGEANTILQEFAQELAFMAKDLNIMVFIFCHLKAPLQGSPHERGGAVHSSQFAGSRAMMRSCHLMLGLEGNKDPDKEEADRNMRRLIILEDRAYGATGYITLYYDTKTGLYHEMKEVSV